MKNISLVNRRMRILISFLGLTFLAFPTDAAVRTKINVGFSNQTFQPARYNVNLRISLGRSIPFTMTAVAKSGKKSSMTDISSDGVTETLVEMLPRKSVVQNKEGLLIDIKVTRTVRGDVKVVEKGQIFAAVDQESEIRIGASGKNREALQLAVLANPI